VTKSNAYHTELHACLFDLLNFIEEQLERAKSDPTEQYVATDAARGVIPLMRSRLAENDHLRTLFMLVFNKQVEEPCWREWWEQFAKMTPQEFSEEANKLLNSDDGVIGVLRKLLIESRSQG
jgi:formate dehydrogenase maturation protein FdhE